MEDKKVSLETAKLAKDKRFGEWKGNISDSIYVHGKYFHKKPSGYGLVNWKESDVLYITGYDNLITSYLDQSVFTFAPTQSLLQKWLRDIHKIDIYVIGYGFGYYAQLNNVPPANQGEVEYIDRRWNMPPEEKNSGQKTWEEALEKGLQEALKLI